MKELLDMVRRTVREELALRRGPQLATVIALTVHASADDTANYEADLRLKHDPLVDINGAFARLVLVCGLHGVDWIFFVGGHFVPVHLAGISGGQPKKSSTRYLPPRILLTTSAV